MSESVQDDRPEVPPVEMDALRVLYQAAGKLRLDPDKFPPPPFGLADALQRVAGRAAQQYEQVNRRALYLNALGYLAGADKRLPQSDELMDTYRDYAQSLAPPELDGAQFRVLVADDGTFDPVKAATEPDLHDDYQKDLKELLNLYEGDVCNIAIVGVGGRQAVAIYSELTTHKAIADLDEWVNPKDWDTWGPALFKEMRVHQPPPEQAVLPPPGIEGYTATFLEHVDLYGRDLQNQLACAYSRGDAVVAMTYDLVESRDDEVTVDRGFVSATAIDDQRSRLRVLKIIGFSDPALQDAMLLSCPLWTDFIRYAAENAEDIVDGHEPAPATMLDVLGRVPDEVGPQRARQEHGVLQRRVREADDLQHPEAAALVVDRRCAHEPAIDGDLVIATLDEVVRHRHDRVALAVRASKLVLEIAAVEVDVLQERRRVPLDAGRRQPARAAAGGPASP